MKIPVEFEYEGKIYKGILHKVAGSGNGATWHLLINNLYQGALFKTELYGWRFSGRKFENIAELLATYLPAE